MSLAMDSLVLDLIFKQGATPEPEALVEALGGEEVVSSRKILDPDMVDPRVEMAVAPSMPFRRRGERRLLIIDDTVAPLHENPEEDPVCRTDLRPEKERLIKLCETGQVRIGRLFGLGIWGDAVLVAEDARDLRGIALLHWVLDPMLDVDGKRRADKLEQKEFEEKINAYEKRLEELGEKDILGNLGAGVNFQRKGNFLVVDCLENDGTWDLRKSMAMEDALAAVDAFSLIPGAPKGGQAAEEPARAPGKKESGKAKRKRKAEQRRKDEEEAAPAGPELQAAEVQGRLVLIFPRERFDLDVAAAIGKQDWDAVLRPHDLEGPERDRVFEHGAGFLAPLEFLSEVFFEGKPLSRPEFEEKASSIGDGARALEVHCPRFGPVLLLDVADKGRYICSERDRPEEILPLLG